MLEPYSQSKTPVVFVHGINGAPSEFEFLLRHLDRSRFQPWVYTYETGEHLDKSADQLHEDITALQSRYRFERLALVAHSMGGLVCRGFILRNARSSSALSIPLFLSISAPWNGHAAANVGVRFSPVVVDVWRDMAPGSDYLNGLFSTALPHDTRHYLVFTWNDRKVSLASQLSAPAQREALRMFGFDNTHTGVLRDPAVASLLNELLDATFDLPPPTARSTP
jgi:pimeloyl-ACP methyl ester carboxylesterase